MSQGRKALQSKRNRHTGKVNHMSANIIMRGKKFVIGNATYKRIISATGAMSPAIRIV